MATICKKKPSLPPTAVSNPSPQTSPVQVPEELVGKFKGCTIAVSGRFPNITHDDIKRLVTALGGIFEEDNVRKCTHLIKSSNHLKTIKVQSALENETCELVSYDWLCKAVSKDPGDIKDLLKKIATLTISEDNKGKKRKLEEPDHADRLAKKQREKSEQPAKSEEAEEDGSPVEVHENGLRTRIKSGNLNAAVIDLLRVFLSEGSEQRIDQCIQIQRNKADKSEGKVEQLDAWHFFKKALTAKRTPDLLYQGLLKLRLVEITVLNKQSAEFKALAEYHSKSMAPQPGVNSQIGSVVIGNIFRIERYGEAARFADWSKKEKVGQNSRKRLLWHGSENTNFIGILSQGLCAHDPTKGAYGASYKGVWMGEAAGTSLHYCRFVNKSDALMLLCAVECGKNEKYLRSPVSSAYSKWHDAGYIHSDLKGMLLPDLRDRETHVAAHVEYVVPHAAQIQQRYLFHMKRSS